MLPWALGCLKSTFSAARPVTGETHRVPTCLVELCRQLHGTGGERMQGPVMTGSFHERNFTTCMIITCYTRHVRDPMLWPDAAAMAVEVDLRPGGAGK